MREGLPNKKEPELGDLGNLQFIQKQKTLNLRNGSKSVINARSKGKDEGVTVQPFVKTSDQRTSCIQVT